MTAAAHRPLAVILPPSLPARGVESSFALYPSMRLMVFAAVALLIAAFAMPAPAQTAGAAEVGGLIAVLIAWSPAIIEGFLTNIYLSILSILLATVLGTLVGVGRVSQYSAVRQFCWAFTQFFRNAPWLVVLFYCMLLLPFSVRFAGFSVPLPDWSKAVLGIAIAAAANMAEVVRGAIQSIPSGQWESAEALGFKRRQIIWMIILPQCVKRMLPGWMNLYALVVVSTPLCSIVGVREVMATIADMLASYGRHDLLMPAYLYLLFLFFAFCFPIARLTRRLERRFAVAG